MEASLPASEPPPVTNDTSNPPEDGTPCEASPEQDETGQVNVLPADEQELDPQSSSTESAAPIVSEPEETADASQVGLVNVDAAKSNEPAQIKVATAVVAPEMEKQDMQAQEKQDEGPQEIDNSVARETAPDAAEEMHAATEETLSSDVGVDGESEQISLEPEPITKELPVQPQDDEETLRQKAEQEARRLAKERKLQAQQARMLEEEARMLAKKKKEEALKSQQDTLRQEKAVPDVAKEQRERPPTIDTDAGLEDKDKAFKTPAAQTIPATPMTAPLTEDTAPQKSTTNASLDLTAESEHSTTSMTAYGARLNKRVSQRLNAYVEQATKNPPSELPPDRGAAHRSASDRKLGFSPLQSPEVRRASISAMPAGMMAPDLNTSNKEQRRSSIDINTLKSKFLSASAHSTDGEHRMSNAEISSIQAKFNKSAKEGKARFVYGEAFREKQMSMKQMEKKKGMEAMSTARGFDVMILEEGKAAAGEVDASNIERTFVFEGNSEVHLHDGTCKVDYHAREYQAYVFLVHRTRGLLLLKHYIDPSTPKFSVPGGTIRESEYLAAAKLTGHEHVQLQIAARDGAARELYTKTGIDVRNKLERLQPAVLRTDAPIRDGKVLLKNENDSKLFYFLQVEENDFPAEKEEGKRFEGPTDETEIANTRLKLNLNDEVDGFRFAKEPKQAAELLQEDENGTSGLALELVMNQTAEAPVPEANINPMALNDVYAPKEAAKTNGTVDSTTNVVPSSIDPSAAAAGESSDAVDGSTSKKTVGIEQSRSKGEKKTKNQDTLDKQRDAAAANTCCNCVIQ